MSTSAGALKGDLYRLKRIISNKSYHKRYLHLMYYKRIRAKKQQNLISKTLNDAPLKHWFVLSRALVCCVHAGFGVQSKKRPGG